MDKFICFCFELTAEDIYQDLMQNGHSTIAEMILAQKQNKGCACKEKNPSGK